MMAKMDRSFYFSPIMKILNNSESQNDARSLSATLGRDLPGNAGPMKQPAGSFCDYKSYSLSKSTNCVSKV